MSEDPKPVPSEVIRFHPIGGSWVWRHVWRGWVRCDCGYLLQFTDVRQHAEEHAEGRWSLTNPPGS